MNKITRILTVVVTCLAIGYFSSAVTKAAILDWYPTLVKPSFNPPNWVFAPVWSLLYVMMGVAAGLVWDKIEWNRPIVKKALTLFAIQLALNALWSYLLSLSFILKRLRLDLVLEGEPDSCSELDNPALDERGVHLNHLCDPHVGQLFAGTCYGVADSLLPACV